MTLLIVLHTIFAIFLVCVILLQPGKGDAGIGFGSSSQSIFGSAGAGNFLTKTTAVCATLFLITSFVLTKSRISATSKSVIDSVPAAPSSPATDAGAKPADAGAPKADTAPPSEKK